MDKIIRLANENLKGLIERLCPGIRFERIGKALKAKCPFFSEGETRFYLWPEKNCWVTYGDIRAHGDAVGFVSRLRACGKAQAISEIERLFAPADTGLKAKTEKVSPVEDYEFEENDHFSDYELQLLGNQNRATRNGDGTWKEQPTITSDDLKRSFPIRSLKSFTYPARDGADYSWRVYSTPDFPIMYWVYESRTTGSDGTVKVEKWGKIYQPKAEKGRRFTYFGKKEPSYIFADNKVAEMLLRVKRGEGIEVEEKLEQLVIVSGGSDAINTYFNGGFHVCWLNSETDILEKWQKERLSRIAKRITVLYDLDETGKKFAYKMALRYLEITLAFLPQAMYDQTGGKCKDVKDFFTRWRTDDHAARRSDYFYMDKFKEFEYVVKNSLALKFWMDKMKDKEEGPVKIGVEIDNEQLYRFLQAYGIRKYSYSSDEYQFVRVKDNIVEEVGEKKIGGMVNEILRDYINRNPDYFDKQLLNAINRSNQLKGQSLQNITPINLDFTFDANDTDYLFFRNGALRITPYDMEMIPLDRIPFNIYKDKIIDHDFVIEKEPLFEVDYSESYLTSDQGKDFPELDRFTLRKNWGNFSYPQFIYNTGEVYWREKENGEELTDDQKKEPDLNFISKVLALGYACRKKKEMTKAYMIMCVEDENNKNGENNGGVGKSLFYHPLKFVRSVEKRDGRLIDPKKDGDLLYVGVVPGKTDIVQFEDLERGFPLDMLFNQITGDMTVRKRYGDPVCIPFYDSPVTILNSNHKPNDIDPSKRRRTWFCTFSNYYHPANPMQGLPARKPDQEFGKEMFNQYDRDEWNKTYFFMAECIQLYMRVNEMVQPVMSRVEKGMLINSLTQNVFDWLQDFFDEYAESGSKLNVAIWRNDLYEEFRKIYSKNVQDRITVATMREKIQKYCQFKRWTLNPSELYRSDSERRREEYRKSRDGKDDFFWYIQTRAISESTRASFMDKSVEPLEIVQPSRYNNNYNYNYNRQQPADPPTATPTEDPDKEKLPF